MLPTLFSCFPFLYRTRVPVAHALEMLRVFQTMNHLISFSAYVLQASPETLVLLVSKERK